MNAAAPEACLWPLDRREELGARLGAVAGIANPGPADRFELAYADVASGLSARARVEAPAVLRVGAGAGALLGVVTYTGSQVRLLSPDGGVVSCDVATLSALLRAPAEAPLHAALEDTARRAGFEGARAAIVRDGLLLAALGAQRVAEGTRLRPASPSLPAALRAAGIGGRLVAAATGYVAQLALLVALWWMVGARAVAAGDLELGSGWILVVGALVVARLMAAFAAGRVAIDGGAVLRERLLHGIFALDAERTRRAGIGQLMGAIVDSEAIESLALGGGLAAAVGLFELITGLSIAACGIAAGWHLAFAAFWTLVALALGARVQKALRAWTVQRLVLTHDLVERMVGQRTVVAQEPPELHHRQEDRALGAYAIAGRALDGAVARLTVLVPRGWLIAAVAILATHLDDLSSRPGAFAASLGGILFVYSALRKLTQAWPSLGAAAIAARNVAPLFAGGEAGIEKSTLGGSSGSPADERRRAKPVVAHANVGGPLPSTAVDQRQTAVPPAERWPSAIPEVPLIAARDLAFRYPGRSESVLSGCNFEIRRGDRILLEGPSGGGKSTLGALLCGLREPTSGDLRYDGVDWDVLGTLAWRARVGAAPQFHENHVFSASLLFNLLLGRAWPPRPEDVAEAEAVCRELDLGPLLARMPSGLEQLVGESGWQLSHGERSRLYIARSLLQPLTVRVLDESFAALDPETLERALACVLRRAQTLLVIAHP
ncbi:MAG TPA: ABC transporter ATP-binding protein [Polyangia bacterium]|nr:ABC transporter ATP-binding protein [Polyangia bacterium]